MGLSYEQKSCCTRCSSSFLTLVWHHKNVRTNESKAKGLDQAFFPKGLRGSRGQSLLGALAAVVNYVYLRNPFADGIND